MTTNWMEVENQRAIEQAKTGKTTNSNAPYMPQLNKKKVSPKRMIKSMYIQESHARAFDKLVFNQKMAKGKNAPELVEEAIELLLKHYEEEIPRCIPSQTA